ncbi:Cell wall-associated hydrolase, NlpC family [Peptoclostridium litorale DSM 5388]|uniref:NLP/P60 protein n=1 Tax=Peptoclostridium litorale DSM 5388 TaxID=1121324 RepID=A0A069RE75_PEPLI|nr:C40 family peptidase [Peptoclostridium litorale]KDR95043.1 NLP/P60 protein [Peptoclostridium litorale DSM 5388]SIN75969.1 Cell wall-associated hydrolase, NlpC family [Peptoclostridium litorale DSM 5388]
MNKKIGVLFSIIVAVGLTGSSSFAQSYNLGKVHANVLNVRSESNSNSSVVSKLNNDSEVLIVDKVEGWYKIKTSQTSEGWISSEYTSVVQAGVDGVVNAEDVNVRQGASLESPVVANLGKGEKVRVIDKNDGWAKVSMKSGEEAYIYDKFVDIPMLKENVQAVSRGGSRGSAAANLGLSLLGKDYHWGAEGPNAFDCSGFTRYVYKKALGKSIPHSSKAQSTNGETIAKSDLQSGDLVFFTTDRSGSVNHVGIYIGSGKFVHASSAKDKVMVSPLDSGFYQETYKWAKRIGS